MKTLSPLFIILLAFSISAQVKKPLPKTTPVPVVEVNATQKVIVEKTNGDKLTGEFIGGSNESITIDLDGNKITIKLSDISILRFGDVPITVETKTLKTNLAIEAALIYNYGGVQPVASETFYLLDESAETILSNAKMQKFSSGLSFLDNYAFALQGAGLTTQYTNYALKATAAIKSHIALEFSTDLSGKVVVDSPKTGKFWIFGIVKTRGGHAIWDYPITIQDGDNKVILDSKNAASAF